VSAYTVAQLHTAIEAALGSVPFTPPLNVAYTASVKVELARRVPGAVLDVYFTPAKLIVEARSGRTEHKFELPLR
jgi:hypothetical protein